MSKYKFDNHNIEFIDPKITISSDNISIHASKMTIEVDILLEVNKARYGVRLKDVEVQNLNYDESTLEIRVLEKLKEFEVSK